jgi:hypothetical protein
VLDICMKPFIYFEEGTWSKECPSAPRESRWEVASLGNKQNSQYFSYRREIRSNEHRRFWAEAGNVGAIVCEAQYSNSIKQSH